MSAYTAMRPDDPWDPTRRITSIALALALACSVTAWANTARELNTLAAYEPVGWPALRAALASAEAAAPFRHALQRSPAAQRAAGWQAVAYPVD